MYVMSGLKRVCCDWVNHIYPEKRSEDVSKSMKCPD